MVISFDLNNMISAALIAGLSFLITVLLMPWFIRTVKRIKFGQEVRDDGPEAHLKKQGTPTMAGVVYVSAALIACIAGMLRSGAVYTGTLQIMFLTLGFGIVGFMDDYLKITRHNTDGLSPKQKLMMQLIFALIFVIWVYMSGTGEGAPGRVYIPFTGNFETAVYLDLPIWLFIPFALFVILGADNGVNFTDGLDGLCGSVTAVTSALFTFVGIINGEPDISWMAAGIFGGLLGFLIFNVYPAKTFMGDTGSLALGGFVAASAVVSGMELYIIIFGFIYLLEVFSVIIQVLYFKKTHGNRFFRMSPIHHHFELCGNSETRIVAAFTIVTLLLSMISLIGVTYVR